MKASIIVCTRARPELLRSCLQALRTYATNGHEVIVVDNAPAEDTTAALVREYPYRYVVESRPGLNHARNRGLLNVSHPNVAYTDDDCIPDAGWIDALLEPYADPRVGATTGLVLPYELETASQLDFEEYCANRRIFYRQIFCAPATPPSQAGRAGMGANMSFRRQLLIDLGGFDVRFDGGTLTLSGGDTEMFARLLVSGAHIVYQPQAIIRHRHTRDEKKLPQVIFGYGVGLFAFFTKRLVEDHDWTVIATAPRWMLGPIYKAVANRLLRRPSTKPRLLFYELWGSWVGPFRYWKVRRLERSWLAEEIEGEHGYSRA